MKHLIPIILLSALTMSCDRENNSLGSGAGSPPPPMQIILPVPLIKQQTTQWCWAASAEMVMTYHRSPNSQCLQATRRINIPKCDCCTFPTPPQCIQPGWPEYEKYNFHYYTTRMGNALSWEELKNEINQNRPVSFSWGWRTGGGHMMNAVGYIERGAEQLVVIHDPWPPSSLIIPYSEFVSSNNHTHWADYYDIRKL